MDLVLLACSSQKAIGGDSSYSPSILLTQDLSSNTYQKLLDARAKLVRSDPDRIPSGPDLGIPDIQMSVEYLPAYQRYTGIIYERGQAKECYPSQSHVRLVIISALYGLLDGDDLIQKYNLKMDDTIAGQRLYTWWKQHSLGDILEEYIHASDPVIVHDFLPINYQKALNPWPRKSIKRIWQPLDCSGLGQGSSYHRGKALRRLLRP